VSETMVSQLFRKIVFCTSVFFYLSVPLFSAEIFVVVGGADNAIVVEGEIVEGDALRLRRLLEEQGAGVGGYRIAFNSPGGNLVEGLKLGVTIREFGLSTSIGTIDRTFEVVKSEVERNTFFGVVEETEESFCASACAYAFLGGASRYILNDYKIGFHKFYFDGGNSAILDQSSINDTLSDAQELMGALVFYLSHLGDIDTNILLEAIAADAEEMNWLSNSDAIKYKIIQNDHYEEFYLEPYKTGIVAASRIKDSSDGYRTELEDIVAQATFFCKSDDFILMLSSALGDDFLSLNHGQVSAEWLIELNNGQRLNIKSISSVRLFERNVYLDIDANFLRKIG
jgi:hypothetical protein